MEARLRPYSGDDDLMKVRELLIESFALYGRPFNWCLERWNFCRYHVAPLHTHYNVRYFSVPTGTVPPHRDERLYWERSIGVWEDEAGRVVGAVTSENEEPGEAWFQVHPDYTFLYDEMLTYAEERLADHAGGQGFLKAYVNDGCELAERVRERG